MLTKSVIQSAEKKNRNAQKALYETTAPYIYTIVKNYIRDEDYRKDLMQEIYANIFHSLKNYDSEKGALKPWIARIAINQCIKFLKRNNKIYFQYGLEAVEEISDDVFAHLDEYTLEDIEKLLEKMPSGYRMVFLLFVIDGYSHKEIAEQLGVTVATSRTQLMRSKKWIKEHISFLTNRFGEYEAL